MERKLESLIDESGIGLRADLWLSKTFPYHSRNEWQDNISAGRVLVNGKIIRPSKKFIKGDIVSYKPAFKEPEVNSDISIIHENPDYLVVNKPANLPCHPSGPYFKNTLWGILSEAKREVFLANRIDRETSGIVLVAKNSETAAKFTNLFSGIPCRMKKKYLALVHGRFPEKLRAEGYLLDDRSSEVRKKRKFVESQKNEVPEGGGEWAATEFRLASAGTSFSAVHAFPETGRLHQIRAVLCSLGYPLVGDKIYGIDDTAYIRFIEGRLTDEDYLSLGMKRQALHAFQLEFPDPRDNCKRVFSVDPPEDMLCFMKDTAGMDYVIP